MMSYEDCRNMENNEFRNYLDNLNDEELMKMVDEQLAHVHSIESDFALYFAQVKKLNELQKEADALLLDVKYGA